MTDEAEEILETPDPIPPDQDVGSSPAPRDGAEDDPAADHEPAQKEPQ